MSDSRETSPSESRRRDSSSSTASHHPLSRPNSFQHRPSDALHSSPRGTHDHLILSFPDSVEFCTFRANEYRCKPEPEVYVEMVPDGPIQAEALVDGDGGRDVCCQSPVNASPVVSPRSCASILEDFRHYWLGRQADTPPIRLAMQEATVEVYCHAPEPEGAEGAGGGPGPEGRWWRAGRAALRAVRRRRWRWRTTLTVPALEFLPGTMTLVLGAPGSGKTMLLEALAGRLQRDSRYEARGVSYNGVPAEESEYCFHYAVVYQDGTDRHLPMMTVRQTVQFALQCRCPRDGPRHADVILTALGLLPLAASLVGDASDRGAGISKGERRRVSIAESWSSNCRVFLANRISDGLDSSAVVDLVRKLRVWCQAMQVTVVVTMMQPPAEVFQLFDQVVLLAGGTVAYCGSPLQGKTVLEKFLNNPNENFSDWVPPCRDAPPRRPWPCVPHRLAPTCGRPMSAQLALCLRRQLELDFRLAPILRRCFVNMLAGVLTASVWNPIRFNSVGLFKRDALWFHVCVECVMATHHHTDGFMTLKQVYFRQRDSRLYRTFSFWLASTSLQLGWGLLESLLVVAPAFWMNAYSRTLPNFLLIWLAAYLLNLNSYVLFCGCAIVCHDTPSAGAMAGLLQVLLFLWSGFLIGWRNNPPWWDWITYISPQSYAYEAMVQVEYQNHTLPCELIETCLTKTGDDHLNYLGVDLSVRTDLLSLAALFLLAWGLAGYLLLALRPPPKQCRPPQRVVPQPPRVLLIHPLPIVMTWHQLGVTLQPSRHRQLRHRLLGQRVEPPRAVLQGVSGIARPGFMVALMGPNGAGKTTLLHLLAGRRSPTAGHVRFNGQLVDPPVAARLTGYVDHGNAHCPTATVLEALMFAALLRLESGMPPEYRRQYCHVFASALHLLPLLDVRVQHLALDEMKYLGVAVELMGNPSVLFLDEPTTGLDWVRAFHLMKNVAVLGRKLGIAVVCTVHQPSALLFGLFTHLVLLTPGGRLAYSGPTGDDARVLVKHFAALPLVEEVQGTSNPINWVMHQLTAVEGSDLQAIVDAFLASGLYTTLVWELQHYSRPLGDTMEFMQFYPTARHTQFAALYLRATLLYLRTPRYIAIRAIVVIVFSLIFGTVFWQLDYSYNSLFDRISFCYTTTYYCGFIFFISSMSIIFDQRRVLTREVASGMYSPTVSCWAHVLAEVPFLTINALVYILLLWPLSSFVADVVPVFKHIFAFWLFALLCICMGHFLAIGCSNFQVAYAIFAELAFWFATLSGFLVPPRVIPSGYLWLHWANPFQYTLNSMLINMLAGQDLDCDDTNSTGQRYTTDVDACPWSEGTALLDYWYAAPRSTELWFWLDQLVVAAFVLASLLGMCLAVQFTALARRPLALPWARRA